MTPQINVSQALFAKLQAIAEPFVDTPETAIVKAVDFYLSKNGPGPATASPNVGGPTVLIFQPDAPPDLTFTRPLSIELEGKMLPKAKLYWNPLLYEVVRLAASKTANVDQLKQMLLCNYVDGEGNLKHGYHFIPGAKLSVQGQSANPAWKTIWHLAKTLGLKIDITFMWEDKPNAAYPTKSARMSVGS